MEDHIVRCRCQVTRQTEGERKKKGRREVSEKERMRDGSKREVTKILRNTEKIV